MTKEYHVKDVIEDLNGVKYLIDHRKNKKIKLDHYKLGMEDHHKKLKIVPVELIDESKIQWYKSNVDNIFTSYEEEPDIQMISLINDFIEILKEKI